MSKYSYLLWMILWLLVSGSAMAQQNTTRYTWQAPLPVVAGKGYYHIALSPAIAAKLNNARVPNFRIYQGNNEVPYLLQKQNGGYDAARFEPFEIVDNDHEGKSSTVIFHNAKGYTLDHFELVFKNARVIKTMQISGSNDKEHWYGVTDAFVFDPASAAQDSSGTTLVKTIPIPSSDYAWYQLIINDSLSAPVFIENIGRFTASSRTAEYTAVPAPGITVLPVNDPHETRLLLHFKQPYLISKLSFNIKAPGLYHRKAALMIETEYYAGKNQVKEMTELASFEMSSERPAQVTLRNSGNYDSLILKIRNDDNAPLQFESIAAWQETIWLTASLEAGQAYVIKGGDDHLPAPVYDLPYFKDSLPANIPVIQPGDPVSISVAVSNASGSVTVFKSKWWIWMGIILVSGVLLFIAVRMLKEMQEKK